MGKRTKHFLGKMLSIAVVLSMLFANWTGFAQAAETYVWQEVDAAGIAEGTVSFVSLDVYGDTTYVAYQDGGHDNKLTVMKNSGSGWTSVGHPGFSAGTASHISLQVAGGAPYVAFRDALNQYKATVMHYTGADNGTGWEIVGSPGFTAGDVTQLSLYADEGRETLYVGYNNSDTKPSVMKFTGTDWELVGIEGFSADDADFVSMHVDSETGTPYVAYQDAAHDYNATVMKFTGVTPENESGWEAVGNPGFSNGFEDPISLYIHEGSPYFAYPDDDVSGKATVLKYEGGNWIAVGLPGFSAGRVDNITLTGSEGTLYVAYEDSGNARRTTVMKYNEKIAADWVDVGSPGFSAEVASTVSFDVDEEGTPYVAYTYGTSPSYYVKVMTYGPVPPGVSVAAGGLDALQVGKAVSGSVTYTLTGGVYAASIQAADFTVGGLPPGLTAGEAVRIDDTTVTVAIGGTPTTHSADSSSAALPESIPAVNVQNATEAFTPTGTATLSAVAKGDGAAVSGAPGLASKTADSITVNAVTNSSANGQTVEYAISQTSGAAPETGWQSDTTFPDLSERTAYYVYARTAADTNYNAGTARQSAEMTTGSYKWHLIGAASFSGAWSNSPSLYVNDGTPYVVFEDAGNSYKATVMTFNGTEWEHVGSAGVSAGRAEHTSLYGVGETLYAAYKDHGNGRKATVMTYDGTEWKNVGGAGFSTGLAEFVSLYVDEKNGETVYVAYKDIANDDKATVMKYTGTDQTESGWEAVGDPGFSEGMANYTSLVINDGVPVVAYQDAANSFKATVMEFKENEWVPLGSDGFSAGIARELDLFLGEDGTLYVAYQDGGNDYKARVMKYTGEGDSGWESVGGVGLSAGSANAISLFVDGDTPYVAYQDTTLDNKATVKAYIAGNWEVVGSAGFSVQRVSGATPTSLYIDGGRPYLAYKNADGSIHAPTVMKYGSAPVSAPVLSETSATGMTHTAATLHFTSDKAGTSHYLVYAADALAPDAATVKLQGAAAAKGTASAAAGANTVQVAGLTASTGYKAYVIVEDEDEMISKVAEIPFKTTSAPPVTPADAQPSPVTNETGVDVLVNGKAERAGTATTAERNGRTVTTIAIDPKKLEEKLAAEGQQAVVTIPISIPSDTVIGELTGQMVKNMEQTQAVLVIQTDNASYTLPAGQVNIDDISNRVGQSVGLQDIKIQIEIAAPTEAAIRAIDDAAAKGSFAVVVPSVEFTVKAVYGDTTIEVSKFTAYVERAIAIPDGVDPTRITTGVVVEADGTVRHAPTRVEKRNERYYAVVNSLTNSTYSVIWHPREFGDAATHWAKDAVNDMGSRMIIEGTGSDRFDPDRDITRAEFASMMVRALGVKPENGVAPFQDVQMTDWYGSAVHTAHAYGLIDGYTDGTFRPNDKITREQAMMIIARAMKLTGLQIKLPAQSAEITLHAFGDTAAVAVWAKGAVADTVQAGIISGRGKDLLAPQGYVTRAEAATAIQRLLKQSELI